MSMSVDGKLVENYEHYYDRDDNTAEWRKLGAVDKCSNIVRLCTGLAHDRVLEIGCGEGALLERLASVKFGREFVGLEISASGVQMVEKKNMPNVSAKLFDGYELPYRERCFDLAILSHVLEHVEYPRRLIREAARVAATVFVEVPLENNCRLSEDFVFDRVGHINFYDRRCIRRLVQSCNMNIVGAVLSHSSLASYVYRKGHLRGGLAYFTKELGLRAWPGAATGLFTYHYSLTYTQA
jgi:SAM-dependent methyltransferase